MIIEQEQKMASRTSRPAQPRLLHAKKVNQVIAKSILEKFGWRKCFDDKCKDLIKIKCMSGEKGCADTTDGETIKLFPGAFTKKCFGASLQANMAHEITHLCDPYRDTIFDSVFDWRGYQVGAACDGDPTTNPGDFPK